MRNTVSGAILPLIGSDFVLLDCPYHFNIGDTLIWRGEQALLSGLPYKCLNQSSIHTFHDRVTIPPSAVILLHGGGNFGDLWQGHQQFRREIIRKYTGNRIIILPQTVFYRDTDRMKSDAEAFAAHPDLTICARDERSFEILKANFSNRIMLVPDSAFCIPPGELTKHTAKPNGKILFIERRDREAGEKFSALAPEAGEHGGRAAKADVRDWPASNRCSLAGLAMYFLRGAVICLGKLNKRNALFRWLCRVTDRYASDRFVPHAVRTGVRFISPYEEVVTSRLHGGILALMLGKKCAFADNSYGKNSAFYRTWLEGTEGTRLLATPQAQTDGNSASSPT